MADKIQFRRDTAANWTSVNPVLANGMPGYETDTCRLKIGDGITAWNFLDYKFEETITTLVESPAGTFTYTSEDGTQTVFTTGGGGGGGEANTATNVGTGEGVFKLKSGIELQFKSILAGSDKVTIGSTTNEVTIDIAPGNINTSELNNDADFIPEAPMDGQQYGRENGGWSLITGGGGPVDHGTLTGLNDDDHLQYLTETRHDALPSDNPHNVNATQVGLGNVNNTSDADKPVSTAQAAADTAVQNFSIQRANHTGTQPVSTITGLATVATSGDYNDLINRPVFGTEYEDFENLANLNITTATLFAARTFTTLSKPAGRYRISMIVQLEPNSTSANYLFQLRINGIQIGLEMEEEGKDVGGDNRNLRPLVGYYDHPATGTFNIELWAARESNTLVLHGVTADVWRVS